MSWAEIKKAVNSDISEPLDKKITTINKSTLMAQAASIDFNKMYPNSNLIINNFNKTIVGPRAETTLLNVNAKGKLRNLTVYMNCYGSSSYTSNTNFTLYINGIKKINFTFKGRISSGSDNPPGSGYALLGVITDLSRIKFRGYTQSNMDYDCIDFKDTSEQSGTRVTLPAKELTQNGKDIGNTNTSPWMAYYIDQFNTTQLQPPYYKYTSYSTSYYQAAMALGLKIIDEPLEFNSMSFSISTSGWQSASNYFYIDSQYELD